MARMKVKATCRFRVKQRFRGFTPEYRAFHVVTLLKELDKWICSHSAVKPSWDEVKVGLGITLVMWEFTPFSL